eukprot:2609995-Rhodomonas_salina.2
MACLLLLWLADGASQPHVQCSRAKELLVGRSTGELDELERQLPAFGAVEILLQVLIRCSSQISVATGVIQHMQCFTELIGGVGEGCHETVGL